MSTYLWQEKPVTVVMPVHNAEPFIADAIASLAKVEGIREVILIDDASSDNSVSVAAITAHQWGLRLRSAATTGAGPQGPSASRNLGVTMITTPLVWFFDADDICELQGVDPRISLVGDRGDVIMGTLRYFEHGAVPPKYSKARRPLSAGLLFMTVETFRATGGFNESLRFGEDLDLAARLERSGSIIYNIEDLIFSYRQHPLSAVHANPRGRSEGLLKSVHAHLQRSKAARNETSQP